MTGGNIILTQEIAEKKLQRMAYEIAERNSGEDAVILAGVKESGYVIAVKIKDMLSGIFNGSVEIIGIELDKKNPGEINISSPTKFDNKVVILVHDVANTGKTLLYSLQPFLSSHPK